MDQALDLSAPVALGSMLVAKPIITFCALYDAIVAVSGPACRFVAVSPIFRIRIRVFMATLAFHGINATCLYKYHGMKSWHGSNKRTDLNPPFMLKCETILNIVMGECQFCTKQTKRLDGSDMPAHAGCEREFFRRAENKLCTMCGEGEKSCECGDPTTGINNGNTEYRNYPGK